MTALACDVDYTRELRTRSVLVVEDSRFMQQLLCAMIRAIGVGDVLRASSFAEASDILEDREIDCAVIDWLMEPVDGLALLTHIRSGTSRRRRMPIVMCTAYADRPRVVALRDAGACQIIVKPVSAAILYDRLMSALFAPRPMSDFAENAEPSLTHRSGSPPPADQRAACDGAEALDLDDL